MNKRRLLVLIGALFITTCDDQNNNNVTVETVNNDHGTVTTITPKETYFTLVYQKQSAGVFLSCSDEKDQSVCDGKKITFTNTNDFPVRIHRVFQYQGETTSSIDLVKPGENFSTRCVDIYNDSIGFYIRTTDNLIVGFLNSQACR